MQPVDPPAVRRPATQFQPWSAQPRPCWHCHHFAGMLNAGSAAACWLPNGPRVRSMPQGGCSAFEREPGADDGDAPPLLCRRAALTGRAPAVPAGPA